MSAKPGTMPPPFCAPGLKAEVFAIDWLHCCDQRVAADYLGMPHAIDPMQHSCRCRGTEKQRLSHLLPHIQPVFRNTNDETGLKNSTAGLVMAEALA